MSDKSSEQLKSMSITEHLLEFRKRLMLIITGIVVCIVALSPFMKELFDCASAPIMSILPENSQLLAVGVTAPVMGPLKVLLFFAFFISLPFTLYQIWAFIVPALYKKEKKIIISIVISSFVMFSLGIIYCYFVVFGMVFSFISSFSPETISFAPDINSYISFVLHMFIAFGVAFEVPVAVVALCKAGITTTEKLVKFRKYIIVASFAVSAVVTPPDVFSQLLLALPIIILYETGLVLCRFQKRVERL